MSTAEQNLRDLAERWANVPAGERANYQLYLIALAEALGVPRPEPKGSGYEFEFGISVVNPNGSTTMKFVDLLKAGHFLLEAKDENPEESRDIMMRRAFGQARVYAAWLKEPPPYLMALDVARTLVVWDRWSGSYGDYHGGYRIHLPTVHERPDDIALLKDIWTNPTARDPRGRAEAITREVAEDLAKLATSLEARGHESEVVARFLIRCVFTMFAEDVGLLRDEPFRHAIEDVGLEDPAEFQVAVQELWRAMDTGGRFGLRKFLKFNGHFFKDQTALPLDRSDLRILMEAARHDWAEVEPSIMGTLLTRALDPVERHRLGAEYTPREFVERLVRPTVEEPIRERWTRVQAEVLQLRSIAGKGSRTKKSDAKKALERLREFHSWLRSLSFLDPACGSGNFLYVTMNLVKEVEFEVVRAIEEITEAPEITLEQVGPWQFHGIEVKAWARELAELTLWIGYHQWWRKTHGHVLPPEPVLQDTGTLELRDAVLVWDGTEEDAGRSRPDPTPRIPHTVTGKLVPDPQRRLRYVAHHGSRPAIWPEADFIVGNPPYLGQARQRQAFGDGYVDALRTAYPDVPDTADYVMYWWHRAGEAVASGRTIRAGLITTNTITQSQNRSVVEHADAKQARIVWAVADHPWVDEAGSADVRVAMTVIARAPERAVRVEVDENAVVVREIEVERLNSDLTAHADVAGASAEGLRANKGLASRGFQLIGSGFILEAGAAVELIAKDQRHADVVKQYRNGRDLTKRPRGVYLIDFGLMEEEEARDYPVLFDIIRTRVKPDRDANPRKGYREYWWRFGEPRRELRDAVDGLSRYIATVETAKHRFFVFLDRDVAPDNKLICTASADAFHLGVLSSTIHATWALAAGGKLGVGNDPVYVKTRCFDAFPFPGPPSHVREEIERLAERLDSHRRDVLEGGGSLTMTKIYNVIEKLRREATLTPAERGVHDSAACGVLRDLHDELDQLVATAYGWEWPMEQSEILSQLVTLHRERVEEEKAGVIRWLRPEYQVPKFGEGQDTEQEIELGMIGQSEPAGTLEWPEATLEQIAALQRILATGPNSVAGILKCLKGARKEHVTRHLETLVIMGEASMDDEGTYSLTRKLPVAA